jgi:ceramide glucosyltransferase
MAVILIFVVFVIAGLALTTAQVLLTLRLLGTGRDRELPAVAGGPWACELEGPSAEAGQNAPLVSILKPISGMEDELEENLISFANLRGVDREIILSVADPDDPALEVIERVRRCFPASRFSLTVGGGARALNPKVERLIAAARLARGRILFISDSNVRVSPDDIAATVAPFRDPTVGCVSNPFVVHGASTFGAAIESLHLISFVLPGCALANALGIPCVVGKSMAIGRDAYEAIGGFQAFAEVLAEDQAMALAIKKVGYKLILSSRTVRNVVINRSLGGAMDRQVRWNKIRYSFSKLAYTAEFLVNPFPLCLLLCGGCAAIHPGALPRVLMLAATTLAARLLHAGMMIRGIGAHSMWRRLPLVPVQDVLQFAAQFKPYFSNEVIWRGHRARLGRGTAMLVSTTGSNALRSGSMRTGAELR